MPARNRFIGVLGEKVGMRRLLLAVLLLAQIAYAEDLEVTLPSTALSATNWGPAGGEFTKLVTVSVHNPTDVLMNVYYEYYDFPTESWKDGGKACSAGPLQTVPCPITLRLALGGGGDGLLAQEFLRFEGRLEGRDVKYTKSFLFYIDHAQSDREISLLRDLNTTKQRVYEVTAKMGQACAGDDCCGLVSERQDMNFTRDSIGNATANIPACRLQEAYTQLQNANLALTRIDGQNLSACLEALPKLAERRAALSQVLTNITQAEACLANTFEARAKWSLANQSLAVALELMSRDDYAGAEASISDAERLTSESAAAIGGCSIGGEPTETPPPTTQATEEPQEITVYGESGYSGPQNGTGSGKGICFIAFPLAGALAAAFAARHRV